MFGSMHNSCRGAQLLRAQRSSQASYLHISVRELSEVVSGRDEVSVGARGGDAAALQHDDQVRAAQMLHLVSGSAGQHLDMPRVRKR